MPSFTIKINNVRLFLKFCGHLCVKNLFLAGNFVCLHPPSRENKKKCPRAQTQLHCFNITIEIYQFHIFYTQHEWIHFENLIILMVSLASNYFHLRLWEILFSFYIFKAISNTNLCKKVSVHLICFFLYICKINVHGRWMMVSGKDSEKKKRPVKNFLCFSTFRPRMIS